MSFLLTLAICAGLVARWALRWHRLLTATLVAFVAVAVFAGPASVLLVAGIGCVALGVWAWRWPASFEAQVIARARSSWRFELIYRPHWNDAVTLLGLVGQVQDRPSIGSKPAKYALRRPELVRVVSTNTTDRLLVKHRLGHERAHWDIRAAMLAESFRAHSCSVEAAEPGYVWLTFRHSDTLTAPFGPLARRQVGDVGKLLEAVPVGRTEDGKPWTLRLRGSHLLIGGATEAGKSSLVWAIIDAVAPFIPEGLVELRGVDPKGNELRAGRELFHHLAFPVPDPATGAVSDVGMVELLEDTAQLVARRAARLGEAGRRRNTITTDEPAVIVFVDELAYLNLYMTDPALRRRAHAAMGTIESQGRAVDVILIGAVQDVRKEAVPLRDLFPTRVGLRMNEDAHADLILGAGAYKAGALCDRIPVELPGVGYVRINDRRPIRVRAAYLSDNDVATLAATYPAPGNLAPVGHDAKGDNLGAAA